MQDFLTKIFSYTQFWTVFAVIAFVTFIVLVVVGSIKVSAQEDQWADKNADTLTKKSQEDTNNDRTPQV